MGRKDVNSYYEMLLKVLTENELFEKFEDISHH